MTQDQLVSRTTSAGGAKRPLRVLLYCGWQVENIGDVAHAPALLALFETHLPDVEVTFWPHYHYLPRYEVEMIAGRFPRVKIVEGKLDVDGQAPEQIAAAMESADLFLHGSGPATIGWREASVFHDRTGRPFGVFGVTYGLYGRPEKRVLSDANFIYFRDSVSLNEARRDDVRAPIMEFGPDAAFAIDLTDDSRAETYLRSNGLEPGRFLVCLPKQRITPTWLHKRKNRAFDPVANDRNETMKEHDHAPLREAIVSITRQTGMKILIGHEDETELSIGKDWLYDHLPHDVRSNVVWRDTLWFVDEAVSIYRRSAGMLSNEMHSPIMCIGHGIPAVVCRWAEQSSKGTMWQDIGLGEWLFDFDNESDAQRMPAVALTLAENPAAARTKAEAARTLVQRHFKKSMDVIRQTLQIAVSV